MVAAARSCASRARRPARRAAQCAIERLVALLSVPLKSPLRRRHCSAAKAPRSLTLALGASGNALRFARRPARPAAARLLHRCTDILDLNIVLNPLCAGAIAPAPLLQRRHRRPLP